MDEAKTYDIADKIVNIITKEEISYTQAFGVLDIAKKKMGDLKISLSHHDLRNFVEKEIRAQIILEVLKAQKIIVNNSKEENHE